MALIYRNCICFLTLKFNIITNGKKRINQIFLYLEGTEEDNM